MSIKNKKEGRGFFGTKMLLTRRIAEWFFFTIATLTLIFILINPAQSNTLNGLLILISTLLILFLGPLIGFGILRKREYVRIREKIDQIILGEPLKIEDLRKKIEQICDLLAIDKCTIYAQDKSNNDLILFFQHNTQHQYMRGLVRKRETSYQIWYEKEPWYAYQPGVKEASKTSAFREREGIKSAMAFPLKNGNVFGIAFFNFTNTKKIWNKYKKSDLKFVERWHLIQRTKNQPDTYYSKLLTYFTNHLSFYLELQRNLVRSPLTQVRNLPFFLKLFQILEAKTNKGLADYLLSGVIGHLGMFHCGVYLQSDLEQKAPSGQIKYILTDESGNREEHENFRPTYIWENEENSKGVFEHVHFQGGGPPMVCVTFGVVQDLDLAKLFKVKVRDINDIIKVVPAFMIFPIYGTRLVENGNNKKEKGETSYTRVYQKNLKNTPPLGFIVVIAPTSIESIDDHSPMAFSLMSDHIGLILGLIYQAGVDSNTLKEFRHSLRRFQINLRRNSTNWKEEIAPLLASAIEFAEAKQADLWVYRSINNTFYPAASLCENNFSEIPYKKLWPRPNGNTFKIMHTSNNMCWPDTKGATSINHISGIKALMGFPIEGIMHSMGVIWIRWMEKQPLEKFDDISNVLYVLFQISGYLLSVTEPVKEIDNIVDNILEGKKTILLEGKKTIKPFKPLSELIDPNNYDEAFLLIKPPNTFKRDTIIEILQAAEDSGCEFHGVKVFSGKELSKMDLDGTNKVEKHLGRAFLIATGQEKLTNYERNKINRVYNQDRKNFFEKFKCYPKDMTIIPSGKLSLAPTIITKEWDEGRADNRFRKPVYNGLNKVGKSKSVLPVYIEGINNGKYFFMLNGYLPGYKAILEDEENISIAILLRWQKNKENSPKWRNLRESVFGDNSNPKECFRDSIRWRAQADGSFFPIENRESVNGQTNVVHFSNSPLEAMRDLSIWFDVRPEDTILGQRLKENPDFKFDLYKLIDPIFEQYIHHRKLEIEKLLPNLFALDIWQKHQYNLKKIWDFTDLKELLSIPERRYILQEFYIWKDTLFSDSTSLISKTPAILNLAAERFKDFETLCEKDNTLSYKLEKSLQKISDAFPCKTWTDGIHEHHFVTVMAINCWIADQIEINKSYKNNEALFEKLQQNLQKHLPRLSERLISYSKKKTSTTLSGSKTNENTLPLGQNPKYKNYDQYDGFPTLLGNISKLGIILAAGRGTRLKTTIPKGMLQLGDKQTIIKNIIETMLGSGVQKVLVAIHERDIAFKEYLTNLEHVIPVVMGDCDGVGFRIAALVRKIKDFKGTIFLSYSDTPFVSKDSIEKLSSGFWSKNADFALSISQLNLNGQVKPKYDLENYGDRNSDTSEIEKIVQSRYNPEFRSMYQDGGVYLFKNDPVILKSMEEIDPDPRGEYIFADVVEKLTKNRAKVIGVKMKENEEALGIDHPANLLIARHKYNVPPQDKDWDEWRSASVAFFQSRGDTHLDQLGSHECKIVLKEYKDKISNWVGPAELFCLI